MLRILFLGLALLSCVAVGCQASREADPVAPTLAGIAARYEPSFQALRTALASRDDVTAAAVLRKLRSQLDRESRLGAGKVAEEAAAAMDFAEGFGRILAGRQRISALDLRLVMEPVGDSGMDQELLLLVTNNWDSSLRLVPGPVSLVLARTRVSAVGRQARVSRSQALDPLEIEVSPGATGRVELGTFGARLTSDTIAERQLFVLELRSGQVFEGSQGFPAQAFEVQPVEYVALAYFLPNSPVEPQELASYLLRAQPQMAPVMERAIRILPERRAEALDLLMPLVDRATEAEFQRLAPALQWLAPEGPEISGREIWLRWLQAT